MRQFISTVYQFDELSDSAKEKARDWFRSTDDDWYAESVLDDAVDIASILGIEIDKARHASKPAIYFSGFSCQGDGAYFEGDYSYKEGACEAIRKHAPQDTELHRIAGALQELQSSYANGIRASVKQRGNYSHAYTMYLDSCENVNDDDCLEPDDEESILELMRDFANWIYKNLEAEYDYVNADEQVDENIRANEYEFTEEGERA